MKQRILSTLVILSIISTSINVFAEDVNSKDNLDIKTIKIEENHKEIFNILELNIYMKGDTNMLPLRKIAEELGYIVEWNNELKQVDIEKDGFTTSIKQGENIFFPIEKTPINLSHAPDIKNGIMYVPFEFFDKVLDKDLLISGKSLVLLEKDIIEESEEMKIEGYIKDIIQIENQTSLLVGVKESDLNLSEIVIHLMDETPIYYGEEEIQIEDIKIGNKIEVLSPKFMTMSLPPQTTGNIVRVKEFMEIEKLNTGKINYPVIKNSINNVSASLFNQSIESFVHEIEQVQIYDNLELDYNISLLNEEKISLIFRGSYDFMGKKNDLIKTLNLDLNTGNEIKFENYFKDDKYSRKRLNNILSENVKEAYGKEFEAEGISMYFTENNVVLYYYELDDSYEIPVEIYLIEESLKELIDENFIK